jgi:hypothetical protein
MLYSDMRIKIIARRLSSIGNSISFSLSFFLSCTSILIQSEWLHQIARKPNRYQHNQCQGVNSNGGCVHGPGRLVTSKLAAGWLGWQAGQTPWSSSHLCRWPRFHSCGLEPPLQPATPTPTRRGLETTGARWSVPAPSPSTTLGTVEFHQPTLIQAAPTTTAWPFRPDLNRNIPPVCPLG